MTTLSAPATKSYPESSLEKKVYGLVEKFKENIPVMNDRNRLGYCLYKYVKGEGDKPEILVKSTKINIVGMTKEELSKKLNEGLSNIKS